MSKFGSFVGFLSTGVTRLATSGDQLTAQGFFSANDWASGKLKTLVVPVGVTLGSSNPAVAGLRSGAQCGGKLVIVNFGEIQGASGIAATTEGEQGGKGGDAFDAAFGGILFINHGALRGGGGGGGKGAKGGTGSYVATYIEGPFYTPGTYYWKHSTSGFGLTKIVHNGQELIDQWDGGSATEFIGGWLYRRLSHQTGEYWSYQREQDRTFEQPGSQGGNGGRGRGYGLAPTNGVAGSAGVNNAGAGGTGGNGAEWGLTGSSGGAGAAGNAGGPASPPLGGQAGFSIKNPGNVSYSGAGTRQGQ